MRTLLIAHRCGTDAFPEQTLSAARYSLEKGADFFEIDIRFTKDNFPVICHDPDGLRIFGNPMKINEMTLKEFAALRHINNTKYHSHTLEDVFLSGLYPVLLHIKEGGDHLPYILEYIRAYKYEDKVVLGVTSLDDVKSVKDSADDMKVLAFIQSKKDIFDFKETNVDIIRLWEEWLSEENVQEIHIAGKQIWVMAGTFKTAGYTIRENILTWVRMGVDGILVNEIEKAKAILELCQD